MLCVVSMLYLWSQHSLEISQVDKRKRRTVCNGMGVIQSIVCYSAAEWGIPEHGLSPV